MPEDEYFARLDAQKKARLSETMRKKKSEEGLEARKALHWMKCGKCGADMESRIHRGVEIEVCLECRAVLLDAGELETLSGGDRSSFFQNLGDLFSPRSKG